VYTRSANKNFVNEAKIKDAVTMVGGDTNTTALFLDDSSTETIVTICPYIKRRDGVEAVASYMPEVKIRTSFN